LYTNIVNLRTNFASFEHRKLLRYVSSFNLTRKVMSLRALRLVKGLRDGRHMLQTTARLQHMRPESAGDSAEGGGAEGSGKDSTKEAALVEKVEDILSSSGSMSTITVPENWPIVPIVAINRYPLFPGFIKKVDVVKDEPLKELLRRKVKMRQPYVGVFVKKDDENKAESVASLADLYPVGSFAQIIEMRDLGAVIELILSAQRRIRLLEPVDDNADDAAAGANVGRVNGRRAGQQRRMGRPPKAGKEKSEKEKDEESPSGPELHSEPTIILARTENVITEPIEKTVEVKATMQAIVQTVRDIVQYNALFGQQINLLLHPSHNVIDNPVYLCDLVATLVQSADTVDLQSMMQEMDLKRRLEMALLLVEKEKTVAKLKHDINKDVERKVQEQHRKFLLNEQLKVIKKELGIEKEDKVAIAEKMEERIKDLKVPEYAMKVIKEEQAKLSFLDPHSSEFSVAR
uniref:Lon N-terminal domain-containing protein n=1 Tax=Toxocara canis TaxID=6265 RepID=A0A183VAQ1_TOXCA